MDKTKRNVMVKYNWKCLKEERYIISLAEVEEYDPDAYHAMIKNPSEWIDGAADCPWKTWILKQVESKEELLDFLFPSEEYDEENEDWYIDIILDSGFYG